MNSSIIARLLLCVLTGAILFPLCEGAAPPPRDPLEEKLPAHALRRFGSLPLRRSKGFETVDWSSDGKWIATGAGRDGANIWDATTGRLLPLQIEQTITRSRVPEKNFRGKPIPPRFITTVVSSSHYIRFATSGKAIYTTGEWSQHPKPFLSRLELGSGKRVTRDISYPKDFAVSPAGNAIAIESEWRNRVLILDATTLKTLHTLETGRFEPHLMCFSRRGDILAFIDDSGRDGEIFLWSVADGKRFGTLSGHSNRPYALAFSPTADILVSNSHDGTTRVWDVAKKSEIRKLDEHPGSLAFCHDGKVLAVGRSRPDEVRMYDTATWKVVKTLSDCRENTAMAFSPDGKRLVTNEAASPRIWDVATGKDLLTRPKPPPGHQNIVSCVRFSPDGKTLYSLGTDQRIIRWDVASGKEIGRLPLESEFRSNGYLLTNGLALSADGKQIAAINGLGLSSRAFLLWDRADDPRSRRELLHTGTVMGLALSPDGRTVAVASYGRGGEVRLWDRDSGRSTLFLVDPAAAKPGVGKRAWPTTGAYAVAFSSDNRTLAAVEPRQVLLWDWRSGALLQRLPVDQTNGLSHAAFSPGGYLVAGCGSIDVRKRPSHVFLWETASGKPFGVFASDTIGVYSSAFSPDGRLLAVAEKGGTVRVWDVFARAQLALFEGHTGDATCVEFSPDGRTLASGSADTTILLWDTSKLRPTLPVSASTPKQLATWWDDLASDDADPAFRAVTGFAGGDVSAVAFLAKRLVPVAEFAPGHLDRLIGRLDDDSRVTRDGASAELEKLGLLAEPALRRTLAGRPPFETKKRAKRILEKAEGLRSTPEALRSSRAVLALELTNSPAAGEMLRRLAAGEPDAERTRAAKSALVRMRGRSP